MTKTALHNVPPLSDQSPLMRSIEKNIAHHCLVEGVLFTNYTPLPICSLTQLQIDRLREVSSIIEENTHNSYTLHKQQEYTPQRKDKTFVELLNSYGYLSAMKNLEELKSSSNNTLHSLLQTVENVLYIHFNAKILN